MGEGSATRENKTYYKGENFTEGKIKQTEELLSLHVSLSPGLKQCWWFISYCVCLHVITNASGSKSHNPSVVTTE